MLDHLPNNDPIHHFNQQFSSKNSSYESWVPPNSGSKPRRPAERYSNWNNNVDGIQLRQQVDSSEETESGVHSPPLWNNIPPESPGSRLQAIVKGQKELMDMVKKMPESYYELTLKDLVQEQTNLGNSQEECLLNGKEEDDDDDEEVDQLAHEKMDSRKLAKSGKKLDGSTSRRINGGSNSMENNNNGLFLKMVFPFGMKKSKSKKKKNILKSSSGSGSSSAKISPKPEGSCDKDWLKKIFSSGSDRSSRSSSSHNTRNGSSGSRDKSSSIRTRRGFFANCLPCFHSSTKGKSAE